MSYDRKQIILERNDLPEGLAVSMLILMTSRDGRLDGPMERSLASLGIFSKDQRVCHTAVVEKKGLGHALAMIKMQQNTSMLGT
jgi:hypothetical protein